MPEEVQREAATVRAGYFQEFRLHWRSLTSAAIGLAAGYSIIQYTANLFTPHLLEAFGWSRSQLALVSSAAVLAVVCQPLGGRLTDRYGVLRVALVGVLAAPVLLLALAMMSGSLTHYAVIAVLAIILVGGTTSATIYSRLVAQRFESARGAALAIAASSPAALAAIGVPVLSIVIAGHGWRAGYMLLALTVAVLGLLALLLAPRGRQGASKGIGAERPAAVAMPSYGEILRQPGLLIILASMLLCNLAYTLQTTQLQVVILDNGVDKSAATLAVSVFAFGVVAGRLLCGLALDRLPTHIVAACAMGLPAIGLAMLAGGVAADIPLMFAAVLLGAGVGAEGDVMAYVVMRYFALEIYSSVLGIVVATIAASITVGSLLLGLVLKLNDGVYAHFLWGTAACILIGSALLLLLKRVPMKN